MERQFLLGFYSRVNGTTNRSIRLKFTNQVISAGKPTTFLNLLRFLPFLTDNLCLNCACKTCWQFFAFEPQKGDLNHRPLGYEPTDNRNFNNLQDAGGYLKSL